MNIALNEHDLYYHGASGISIDFIISNAIKRSDEYIRGELDKFNGTSIPDSIKNSPEMQKFKAALEAELAKRAAGGAATKPPTELELFISSLPQKTDKWLTDYLFGQERDLVNYEEGKIHLSTTQARDLTARINAVRSQMSKRGIAPKPSGATVADTTDTTGDDTILGMPPAVAYTAGAIIGSLVLFFGTALTMRFFKNRKAQAKA